MAEPQPLQKKSDFPDLLEYVRAKAAKLDLESPVLEERFVIMYSWDTSNEYDYGMEQHRECIRQEFATRADAERYLSELKENPDNKNYSWHIRRNVLRELRIKTWMAG